MDDILSLGNLTASFITDPVAWKVFATWSNEAIADFRPEDWCNEQIDFRSREAGQLLLSQLSEVYETIPVTAAEEATAEMVKNDQGITKDVPDTAPDGTVPATNDDQPWQIEEILLLLESLVDEAETASPEEQAPILAAIERVTDMHMTAVLERVATLVEGAENNTVAKTAALDEIITLLASIPDEEFQKLIQQTDPEKELVRVPAQRKAPEKLKEKPWPPKE